MPQRKHTVKITSIERVTRTYVTDAWNDEHAMHKIENGWGPDETEIVKTKIADVAVTVEGEES